ncbi:ABC transporter ATP-binding protein [Bacillus rubiinfantis]|uniref:ABC transporter ATP-binding protein n=1 Tax=Bacillus rubiinfantis TaxID=1499680 RepID=UPI0005A8FF71|nr:ABC transporter ATP-binding protein [Bacillus rubiinfantis]
MKSPIIVNVENISKSFANNGQVKQILKDISIDINRGEIVSILGESGCGKSTLLNLIGGFDSASEGQIIMEGQKVTHPSRKCIMLFQDYGLFPWKTVQKNVEVGLEVTNANPAERLEKALKYLRLVGLEEKVHLFPHQISGGMQQRVAIARALAIQPELILMDEPFAALDTFNRYYLQDELLKIQSQERTTIILVTHDIDEAIYLSDRILIMSSNPGKIHKELTVPMSKPRDRSSSDFQYFRKIILEEFHFNRPGVPLEYNI